MATEDTTAPPEHSPGATFALAEAIRDLLKDMSDDPEADVDIDVWDNLTVKGNTVSIRLDDGDELEYTLTLAPFKD